MCSEEVSPSGIHADPLRARGMAGVLVFHIKRAMALEADSFRAVPAEKRLRICSNANGVRKAMKANRATLPLFPLNPKECRTAANDDRLRRKSVQDQMNDCLMNCNEHSTKLGSKK